MLNFRRSSVCLWLVETIFIFFSTFSAVKISNSSSALLMSEHWRAYSCFWDDISTFLFDLTCSTQVYPIQSHQYRSRSQYRSCNYAGSGISHYHYLTNSYWNGNVSFASGIFKAIVCSNDLSITFKPQMCVGSNPACGGYTYYTQL